MIGPLFADVVVVSCSCGQYPLGHAMHRTSREAWHAASDHVALNPRICRPTMRRETVPVGLLPSA